MGIKDAEPPDPEKNKKRRRRRRGGKSKSEERRQRALDGEILEDPNGSSDDSEPSPSRIAILCDPTGEAGKSTENEHQGWLGEGGSKTARLDVETPRELQRRKRGISDASSAQRRRMVNVVVRAKREDRLHLRLGNSDAGNAGTPGMLLARSGGQETARSMASAVSHVSGRSGSSRVTLPAREVSIGPVRAMLHEKQVGGNSASRESSANSSGGVFSASPPEGVSPLLTPRSGSVLSPRRRGENTSKDAPYRNPNLNPASLTPPSERTFAGDSAIDPASGAWIGSSPASNPEILPVPTPRACGGSVVGLVMDTVYRPRMTPFALSLPGSRQPEEATGGVADGGG